MAGVREYLRSRARSTKEGRNINYKEKIRSHKLAIFYRGILGAALMAVVAAMMIVSWKNRKYGESVIVNSIPVKKVEGAAYLPLGNHILTYSKDGANCMNGKGEVLWNQTYGMKNPMVDINGSVAAIGDYDGRKIYVMNTSGRLGEITTNLPIRKFSVAANGVVAVILDDAKVMRIHLYDTSGKMLVDSEKRMSKSGYPMDISLSPDGRLLAISYLYVDRGILKSSVAFHNFGEVGQNLSSDRFVSGYDYKGAVVPFIRFMNSNTVFAVSDDRIMFFTGNQKPVSSAENLLNVKVQGVFYSEKYVGLVFLNTEGGGKYRLNIYDEKGSLVTGKNFDLEYTNIVFHNDEFMICSDIEYSIYNIYGTERFSGQFDEIVYLFVPQEKSSRFLIMTQNAMRVMEMK